MREAARAMYFKDKSQRMLQGSALKTMSKREVTMMQKTMQNITLEKVKDLYERIPKDERAAEMEVMNPLIEDEFHRRTGIESELLEVAYFHHKLHEDAEVQAANKEFEKALDALKKDD